MRCWFGDVSLPWQYAKSYTHDQSDDRLLGSVISIGTSGRHPGQGVAVQIDNNLNHGRLWRSQIRTLWQGMRSRKYQYPNLLKGKKTLDKLLHLLNLCVKFPRYSNDSNAFILQWRFHGSIQIPRPTAERLDAFVSRLVPWIWQNFGFLLGIWWIWMIYNSYRCMWCYI